MQRYEFSLNITAEKYLDYYRGAIRDVVVTCRDGLVIQFPALLLKAFILEDGIHGRFELTCDNNNKGAKLRRLG